MVILFLIIVLRLAIAGSFQLNLSGPCMSHRVTIPVRSVHRDNDGRNSATSVCGHELRGDSTSSVGEGRLSVSARIELLHVPLACRLTGTREMPGCRTPGKGALTTQRSLPETALI